MTTGIVHDQNLEKQIEKQMGCMTGFLHLFDRHQILTGKRLYTPKRIPHPHSPKVGSVPEQERPAGSPAFSAVSEKVAHTRPSPSPDRSEHFLATDLGSPAPEGGAPAETPTKAPVPLQGFEYKESGTRFSWKFKEAPRLSLDSRATVDARGGLHPKKIRTNPANLSANRCENSGDGGEETEDSEKQRRSPSVIARLMGLEPLQGSQPSPQAVRNPELRRSASESRVSRDLFQFRLSVDGNSLQMKQPPQLNSGSNAMMRDNNVGLFEDRTRDLLERSSRIVKSEPPNKAANRGFVAGAPTRRSPQQRKSYFDSADFFPGPKHSMSVYGEIDRRLKMRGIEEPSQDLETLKQILEGLQLKGLLHSRRQPNDRINNRNFVVDGNFSPYESPIIVMKPSRSGRIVNEPPPSGLRSRPGARRNPNFTGESPPTASPRRSRPDVDLNNARNVQRSRNSDSPTRSDGSTKSTTSSTLCRRKPLQVETHRKVNETTEPRRRISSPIHSPKLSSRGFGTNPNQTVSSRSPRNRKSTAEIYSKEDESSSVSAESSLSTSSQTETERWKGEYYGGGGRNILERCDKLLHSIAEMTATELQPSPVSVLDSSFYKEEESSPSPVTKRSIDFRALAAEFDDEIWPAANSPEHSGENTGDCDFVYVSEILRAPDSLREESDIFLLLEKRQYLKGRDTSEGSRLRRKLIFDTIGEIVDRKRRLPPWRAVFGAEREQIWSEFQRIRDVESSEDTCELIRGVLRKDLAGDAVSGWGDFPVESAELVLDIERQVFKDLIGETIQSLASLAGKITNAHLPRRKLVF